MKSMPTPKLRVSNEEALPGERQPMRVIDFPNVEDFEQEDVETPFSMSAEGWRCGLRETEIDDHKQKLKARPWIAWGVGLLLIIQNLGVWFIVVWALNKGVLADLQFIFATLIAGSLTQSYFLLKLITGKVFGDINYHNGEENEY